MGIENITNKGELKRFIEQVTQPPRPSPPGGGAAATGAVVNAISNSQASRSGTVNLSGAGAVTVGTQTGNAFTINAPVQTVQTQQNVQSIAASDTTYHTGQVQFTGSNAVTVKSSANQRVVIDAPTQTVQTQQNVQSIAASDTTYHTGQVQFTGSNMVTVKSSANQRVVIDATQSVQTQGLVRAISADATADGTVRFSNANGISFGSSGGVGTITASKDGPSAIVASNATFTSGTVVFSGGANITVNTSGAGANQTIGISAAAPGAGGGSSMSTTMAPFHGAWTNNAGAVGNASLHIQPIHLAGSLTAATAGVFLSMTCNSNSTNAQSIWVGLYSRTGSSLSLASSGSSAFTWTSGSNTVANAAWASATGVRRWDIPVSWSATPGEWYYGIVHRSTNNGTFSYMGISGHASLLGPARVHQSAATGVHALFDGYYSATTAGLPSSIGQNQITATGPSQRVPAFQLLHGDTPK